VDVLPGVVRLSVGVGIPGQRRSAKPLGRPGRQEPNLYKVGWIKNALNEPRYLRGGIDFYFACCYHRAGSS
jgi:hypothetical protein